MQKVKQNMITIFFTITFIFFSGNRLHLYAAWAPPVQISAGPASLNTGTTPLVIDHNSNALIGWLDGPIGVAQTLSSATLFPQCSVWTAPQTIYNNPISGLFPSFPTMAFDDFGNQIAGFSVIDPMGGTLVINASRRPFGSTNWQAPITQATNGIPSDGSLAVGNLGNFSALLALSTTGGTPPFDITLVQLPANSSSWSVPIVIAHDNSPQPAVAATTLKGNSTLVWKVNSPNLQIQTARFDFQTQKLSPLNNVPLPPLATDILAVDLATDSKGDSILIYGAQIGSNVVLYSSTLFAGQNAWTDPLLISDPANTVIGASIASDAVGNATLFWGEQITPTQQYVRVATLPLGGFPILVTNLTSPTNLNTTVDATSRVGMDSFGNAVSIWGITMGGAPMIQVSSKAIGQNWTTPETLSFSGYAPLVTLSDQGTAVAAWLDSVTNILMGSRNLFLFPLAPPSDFFGKVIANKFLTDTAYYLKIHWKQSPAPNITSYEIFKNRKLIATTSGNGPFKFLLPLHSKHVKGTYTLVATASNGNKSEPIPIIIRKK